MMAQLLALLLVGEASGAAGASSSYAYPFLDPSLTPDARIADLLPRVSLQQKINSLQTKHEAGIPGGGVPASPGYIVLPKYTIETYSTSECLHGYCSASNMTVFAHSITLAASFDTGLLKLVGAKIGEEARAVRNEFEADSQYPNKTASPNGLACFSPQINIVRDPRWGRAQETYGEDPFLTAALAYGTLHTTCTATRQESVNTRVFTFSRAFFPMVLCAHQQYDHFPKTGSGPCLTLFES